MSPYLTELASLMAIFAFVIVSPGADLAMVIRQSVSSGRKAAIITSIGIGASLMMHMTYTILGLGLIISQSILLFNIIKWLGVAYLVTIGIMALRSSGAPQEPDENLAVDDRQQSATKSFLLGFAANALNPKPVFFFLSVFATIVSHETPDLIKFCYGMVMAGALIAWFVAVSFFMTTPAMRANFRRASKFIDRASGLVFISFGLKLATERAQ